MTADDIVGSTEPPSKMEEDPLNALIDRDLKEWTPKAARESGSVA
jgi:hypothetical protein